MLDSAHTIIGDRHVPLMEDSMKRTAVIASCLAALAMAAAPLAAQGLSSSDNLEVQGFYSFPNNACYGSSSGFAPVDYGSGWGGAGAKAIVSRSYTMPALVSAGALTEGNNLALSVSSELAPVSINTNVEATLTPLAFLKFSVGAGLGSGWSISPLGFTGLGLNNAGVTEDKSFGGIIYRAWASGTFQFDLAAVMPGDWNHIVVLASPKIEYDAFTGATASQAWIWEADSGMNYNGLKLKGSYVLAYQMPLALSMAGLLLEPEGYIGSVAAKSTMATGGWGSDYTKLALSAIFNFTLSDKASIAILPQIKSDIKWSDATAAASDFTKRVYEGSYWYFNRIAFDFNLKI
jgi:hypothetical protein